MHYLLIGNAPDADFSAASQADVIVQINGCPHAGKLPRAPAKYVFLLNADPEISSKTIDQFLTQRDYLRDATIVLPRNSNYYALKKWVLWGDSYWRNLRNSHAWKRLKKTWPIEKISFLFSMSLDLEMIAKGMPKSHQPSTGLIAYKWLLRRMRPEDSLAVTGFTFEGWERHPWHIEKQIIKSLSPLPGARRKQGVFQAQRR